MIYVLIYSVYYIVLKSCNHGYIYQKQINKCIWSKPRIDNKLKSVKVALTEATVSIGEFENIINPDVARISSLVVLGGSRPRAAGTGKLPNRITVLNTHREINFISAIWKKP